jgi:hypothetical protein
MPLARAKASFLPVFETLSRRKREGVPQTASKILKVPETNKTKPKLKATKP